MAAEVSVKCDVFKYKSFYRVRIKTLEGFVWEAVFEKHKVFDTMGEANESVPIKGRVNAFVITHNSTFASIEFPVEDKKIGKRINIPLNCIWPPPSSG
ncbi:MAG: hypothetical protein KGK03_01190 [Candidatus Omnitrophica bacterium]|nr:hypothetical protein [Candidatus Omnitrophota bacterium]MDE2221667.1 hypothetical protein [Candidatus Omnitrophota bacterium]